MKKNQRCTSAKVRIEDTSCRRPRGGTPSVKGPQYVLAVTNNEAEIDEDKPVDIPQK